MKARGIFALGIARYQYKFRDQARAAKAEHEIGEVGRVA